MSAQSLSPAFMDLAEFLDWSAAQDGAVKYELVDGEPRAMAAAGVSHGTVQANLAGLIWQHLRATRPECRVVTEPAVIPPTLGRPNLRIPDLGVSCRAHPADAVAIDEPVLLIEILSTSNERHTRSNSWVYYAIPSVREVMLVHLVRRLVEIARRGAEGAWHPPELIEAGGTAHLETIAAALSLDDIYSNVAFHRV